MMIQTNNADHHWNVRMIIDTFLLPDRNPLLWLIINSICCAYSAQLLLIILFDALSISIDDMRDYNNNNNDIDDQDEYNDDDHDHGIDDFGGGNPTITIVTTNDGDGCSSSSSSVTTSHHDGMAFAQQTYLVYNFTTTIVWCIEAFFNSYVLYYQHRERQTNPHGDIPTSKKLSTYVEWIVAIYFLLDSLHELYKWKFTKQDIDVITISVVITFVVYLYRLVQDYPIIQTRYTLGYQYQVEQEQQDQQEQEQRNGGDNNEEQKYSNEYTPLATCNTR